MATATATSTEVRLKFVFSNETKGAVMYREILPNGNPAGAPNDPGAVVGVLYRRKSSFAGTFPKELTVIMDQ